MTAKAAKVLRGELIKEREQSERYNKLIGRQAEELRKYQDQIHLLATGKFRIAFKELLKIRRGAK